MADLSTDPALENAPLVRVGCAGLPTGVSRAAYFERLDFLEVENTFFDPPTSVALRRWRKDAPQGSAFSALAWQLITHEPDSPGYERLVHPLPANDRAQVGSFRDTDQVRSAWDRTLEAARALSAEVILFQTPPSFTPSETNKDVLRRFFERIGPVQGTTLAWEPRGVWDPEQAASLAEDLGVVYALDPLQLEVPPPEGANAYFRIYGLGIYRNKIADDLLELLADMAGAYDRAWVVFANVEKYPDAQRFRKLLAGREFVEDEE
jgi:uncharacterized protein YecE (DUF72 family)